MIAGDVKKSVEEARTPLILSDRIEHLQTQKALLDDCAENVILITGKGTLAQYCGRLHRNFAGKEEVIIYDYVDFRVPIFDRMYQNRLKGYKQLGYTIGTVISIFSVTRKRKNVPCGL